MSFVKKIKNKPSKPTKKYVYVTAVNEHMAVKEAEKVWGVISVGEAKPATDIDGDPVPGCYEVLVWVQTDAGPKWEAA